MRVQNNGAAYYKQSYLWEWRREKKQRETRDMVKIARLIHTPGSSCWCYGAIYVYIIVSDKWKCGGFVYAVVIINIQNNRVYYHGYSMSGAGDKGCERIKVREEELKRERAFVAFQVNCFPVSCYIQNMETMPHLIHTKYDKYHMRMPLVNRQPVQKYASSEWHIRPSTRCKWMTTINDESEKTNKRPFDTNIASWHFKIFNPKI